METRERLIADLKDGYSYGYLQEKYGVGRVALGRWVVKYGLERPTERVTGYEKLLDLKAAVLRDYVDEGVGMRELKMRFGVHEGTIRTFLAVEGVLKPRGAQCGVQNPQAKARQVSTRERDSGKYWARRAVEIVLGQKLPTGWVIHHMNECPTDQTLSNLWLFRSTGAHSQFHQRLRASLTAGGQLAPSRMAKDSGGLWLPETLDRLQYEPGTELRSL